MLWSYIGVKIIDKLIPLRALGCSLTMRHCKDQIIVWVIPWLAGVRFPACSFSFAYIIAVLIIDHVLLVCLFICYQCFRLSSFVVVMITFVFIT